MNVHVGVATLLPKVIQWNVPGQWAAARWSRIVVQISSLYDFYLYYFTNPFCVYIFVFLTYDGLVRSRTRNVFVVQISGLWWNKTQPFCSRLCLDTAHFTDPWECSNKRRTYVTSPQTIRRVLPRGIKTREISCKWIATPALFLSGFSWNSVRWLFFSRKVRLRLCSRF